jgi:hypothetical protein
VRCRDGRNLDVRVVWFGKGPVLFTLDGTPCTRGGPYRDLAPGEDKYLDEGLALAGFLRAVHRGDEDDQRRYLVLLDKSAGRAGERAAPPAPAPRLRG